MLHRVVAALALFGTVLDAFPWSTQGHWEPTSSLDTPSPRSGHTAVWTGTEMLIWGGTGSAGAVARYDPVADHWQAVEQAGAPDVNSLYSTVWTGRELIIWGGFGGPSVAPEARFARNDGARFEPTTNTWAPVSLQRAPSPRWSHTAVWTGAEMIVWGGYDPFAAECCPGLAGDGARYDPRTDSWRPMSTAGAPSPRAAATVVWTGEEMVIWGGTTRPDQEADGAIYNPATDSWRAMSAEGAPSVRIQSSTVWTGMEMLIWGGLFASDGGRYHVLEDRWTPITTDGAPSPRRGHSAVWTGSEMIVWGGGLNGRGLYPTYADGAGYNLRTDTWRPLSPGPLSARGAHSAVWTGNAMIIWGGTDGIRRVMDDGARYYPG